MGKPEIPVGKSHASHHSILEASEKIRAVICGDAIFLLFSACSADLHIPTNAHSQSILIRLRLKLFASPTSLHFSVH